jgi:tripartite-type tricarboxylate transporter receptor subunit TctC
MSNNTSSFMNRRQLLSMTALTIALPAWSQSGYPSKHVTIVVPFPAGGTTDILGRLLGRHLATRLGGTVVVDNKPGAGGAIGSAMVAKAAGDGHTLLMGTIGTHSINQYLYKKLAYDPFKDFAPIGLAAMVPNVLVVNPSQPIKTVKDLIAAAKAAPGKLTYASAGNGTSIHLCGAMFEQMAQVSMAHVPYRGSAPAITDLLGNQTTCMFDNLPSAMPHIKSGALRAVAVTTAKRSAALHDCRVRRGWLRRQFMVWVVGARSNPVSPGAATQRGNQGDPGTARCHANALGSGSRSGPQQPRTIFDLHPGRGGQMVEGSSHGQRSAGLSPWARSVMCGCWT